MTDLWELENEIYDSGVSLICGDNANSIKVSGTLRAVSGSGDFAEKY